MVELSEVEEEGAEEEIVAVPEDPVREEILTGLKSMIFNASNIEPRESLKLDEAPEEVTASETLVDEKTYPFKIAAENQKTRTKSDQKKPTAQCEVCQKVITIKHLRKHLKSHSEEVEVECRLCYIKFNSERSLNQHYTSVHWKHQDLLDKELTNEDLKFPCDECDKRFVSEDIMMPHKQQHENTRLEPLRSECFHQDDQVFKCKLCYKICKKFAILKRHLSVNHREDSEALFRKISSTELIFDCDICDFKFISQNVLRYHRIRDHDGASAGQENSTGAERSMKRVPPEQPPNQCKLCYLKCGGREALRAHEESIHRFDRALLRRPIKPEDLKYNCSCSLSFVSENIMMVHRRISFCDLKQ